MSSDSYWIVPPQPPGGGTWKGCALLKKPDGGDFVLFSPNAVHLSAMLQVHDAHQASIVSNASQSTSQDNEMTEFMVMGRCRHLLDGYSHTNPQSSSGQMAESLNRLHADLKGTRSRGQKFITAAYVGFDSCMQGPVFARAAKDAASSNPSKSIASNEANQSRESNGILDLKDLSFSCGSASSSGGQGFIPHYAVTSRANMGVLVKLLTGHSLENVLHYRISRYTRHVRMLIQDLDSGGPLVPFAYTEPDVRSYMSPGKDLRNILEQDEYFPSDHNLPISQIACDTLLLSRQDNDGLYSGYRYQAALTEALEYPDELLSMLEEFATLFPHDILPLRTLLLGCHLWADITGHRVLYLERLFQSCEDQSAVPQVPDVPLAVCLVYYPHWLKWTECMGLSEFPHPFRFMSQALKSDMDKEAIGIDPDSIDQARVYSLIAKAKSRIPLMDATHRIEIMPCYMPGSKMPPMFGPTVELPEKVPLALTGLPDVQYLGLKSYIRPDSSKDERPSRMQSIQRTSKYTTVSLPRHVRDDLFAIPGRLFETSTGPNHVSNDAPNKRRMEPVGSGSSLTGRPPKKARGLDVTQSDASTSNVTAGGMSTSSTGHGWEHVCREYENVLNTWAEAQNGVAHWAHQEGLQQFNELPESQQSGEKLREMIDLAFAQEDTDALHLLKDFGIRQASSNTFPLGYEFLSIDMPLAFGKMLGLRPPANPSLDLWRSQCLEDGREAPDLWRSYFMLQCLQKGGRTYLRAKSIRTALQRSIDCPGEQQEILRVEVIRLLSDLWRTSPNGWRGKLERFIKEQDSFTICSTTGNDSLYEDDSSDTDSTWDGEDTSDEEST